MDIVIYHNPACGTSRKVLAAIREAGIEPHVVEYLKTPPSRAMLRALVGRMGIPARDLLRPNETAALGLQIATDEAALDAMAQNPALMNRPVVVGPRGVRLCRPSETVLDLLA